MRRVIARLNLAAARLGDAPGKGDIVRENVTERRDCHRPPSPRSLFRSSLT